MFGLFKKTDRYNELYDHLVYGWKMKSGFAAAFINEYRDSLSKQYEKGLTFHRQEIMSQDGDGLEMILLSLRDTTIVSQAYLSYMHDLRSGKHVGTNIEKAIWAILISRRKIVATHNADFVEYLLESVDGKFPSLIFTVFNDPLS